MRTLITAAVILAAACGSATNDLTTGQTSCSATLSGAVTATNVTCEASAGFDGSQGAIGFVFTSPPTGYQVVVGIDTSGAPADTTYTNTSALKGACEVTNTSNGASWVADHNAGSPDQGTFSMTVSSLGNQFNNPDGGAGTVYLSVHGSVNCTMPAVAGTSGSGTVTLSATF